MKNHTKKDTAADDKLLKARMNFSKMFDRQEKQISETPHIQNLLTPSTKENSKPVFSYSDFEQISEKLERIEGLVEASRISRIENAISDAHTIKKEFKINNPKPLYALAVGLLVIGFSLAMTKATPIIKTKTVTVAPKLVQKYVVTDYINLRAKASGSAKKLTVLAPNFTVELIESKRGWNKVKYTDLLKNKDLIGWVYGTNFKAL
jgi:hypothetical protein